MLYPDPNQGSLGSFLSSFKAKVSTLNFVMSVNLKPNFLKFQAYNNKIEVETNLVRLHKSIFQTHFLLILKQFQKHYIRF
jgi:hypothetical protein